MTPCPPQPTRLTNPARRGAQGRFSEDPEALIKVMERAPYFELNADLSHYLYRNIQKGCASREHINMA